MSGEVLAKGHSRMEAVRDARVGAAHEAHQEATDLVCSYLASRRVSIRLKETLSRDDIEWAHLVLSIGGDGTFLRASHSFNDLETTPLLGIKSVPLVIHAVSLTLFQFVARIQFWILLCCDCEIIPEPVRTTGTQRSRAAPTVENANPAER